MCLCNCLFERQAAALEKDLDEKERGFADNLAALAAGDLVAAWKLEAAPREPNRLLKVKVKECILP